MENLTQKYRVVKADVPPAPMKGYKVVVFEKTTHGGTTFSTILNPGDSPLKGRNRFLSSAPKYSCCAVSSDNNLNFDLETQMTLVAQQQYFILKCTIYYYISSPKLMARIFETDPIRRIKDELEKRLKRNALQSKIHIQDVLDDFFEIKEKILPYSTLNQLRDFAGEFGVIIKEVDMTYTIPEKYLQAGRKEDDYFLQKKTAYIDREKKDEALETEKEKLHNRYELRKITREHEKGELSHKNELIDIWHTQDVKNTHHAESMKDVESFHEYRREMPKLLVNAIGNAVGSIDSPESLEKVANASIGVIKKVATEIQSPNHGQSGNQLSSTHGHTKAISSESSDPLDEVIQFLLNIQTQVEGFTSNPDDKNVMLSCISHLLGEIRLGKNADMEIINKYIGKLNDYALKYRKILPRYVLEQMSKFKDKIHQIMTVTTTIPG